MKLPQLSLRDLFWLVALVAMGCGWWVEHRAKRQQEEEVRKLLLEMGNEMAVMNAELVSLRGVQPLAP